MLAGEPLVAWYAGFFCMSSTLNFATRGCSAILLAIA